jgi:hypothetical protein
MNDKDCLRFIHKEENWHDYQPEPADDMVNSPAHYQHYPLEVIEIIRLVLDQPECDGMTAYQAYCLGNSLKYRLRAGHKNPDKIEEDIQKALWYAERQAQVVNVTV